MRLGDPCTNVRTGAWILAQCVRRYGYNWKAVGCYHSNTPGRRVYRETLLTIATAEADEVAGMIQDVLENPQEYYAKVSSSLRTALVELSSGNIGRVIGNANENRFIERLEKGKRVIFAIHSGSLITREAAATLCKVIISIIQFFIGRTYLSKRRVVNPPLSIYMDEAQSLLY
jgi:conjugal transfer pilus assembly protein TraD